MNSRFHHRIMLTSTLLALALLMIAPPQASAQDGGYYEDYGMKMFNPYPTDQGRQANRGWRVRYFGPVGIGIDLVRPGMTMKIWNIEEGSPAAATGKLEKGQIIESINGVVLKDRDPRFILGDIITEAEATDGKINLKIKDVGDVLVQIPVMGTYSETWPVNCPKSDKIVRNLADLIAKEEKPSWGSVLFMLSTGEEKDLDVVRKWMDGIETIGGMNWEKGYKGIGLCEYYLRTGDQSVLPVIKKMTEELKENMYNGGWSGRGKPASFTYSTGTGQVHASGIHCMTFLLLARLCGVDVDQYMFEEAFKQFYRFAGHGNVPYGNGPPEGGLRDNGKHSGLAVALAVATQLAPQGEESVYAEARDNAAMKAFYATNWFHAAHTGGGMGEIWHHGAVALMREKRPNAYRSYHDTRRWVMDTSRRHDGSVAIEGMDDRYNRSLTDASGQRAWGTYFALTYTYPRKTLQIWGAPRSPYAKSFPLPDRPWGNETDDAFQSMKPAKFQGKTFLTEEDLMAETVETSSSVPILTKTSDPNMTEQDLMKVLCHPEFAFRTLAANRIVSRGWNHLVVPLLKAEDPRLRHAGLLTITGMFKGRPFPDDQLTPEMFDAVGEILENPNEAWWVTQHAVEAMARADAQRIAKHRDRLLELVDYDSDWMQSAAVVTLTKIATDPRHYRAVLPPIIKRTASFTIDSSSWQTTNAIRQAISKADPQVKAFAAPLLKEAYLDIPNELTDPYTKAVMANGARTVRSRVGSIIREIPGGEDYISRIPKTTLKSFISGRDSDMYRYSGRFTPNKKLAGTWHWAVWPSPNSPGEVNNAIDQWLKPRLKNRPVKEKNPKDVLVLKDGGKVEKSRFYGGYFWTDDMLVSNTEGQALKMQHLIRDGVEFLLVERQNLDGRLDDDGELQSIPKDYHPGFHVYIRN